MAESRTKNFAYHVGRSVGKYKLENLLGRGAMAEVYKSIHPDLQRDIAVKILHPFHTQVPGFIGRFRHEARAAASLHHPNIVQVHDFSVTKDGLYYMVMQFINGLSLEEYLSLEKSPLSLSKAFLFFRQIANALQFAHQRGMVHRDVKPANVMLDTRENAYLSDFGLAKITGVDRQTLSSMSPGTPSYMAPEQMTGEPVSAAADIYAMGVILYRMVTNHLPYEGESLMSIITNKLMEPPTPPRQFNSDLPKAVEKVVLKSLARKPEDRFSDITSMSRALEDAVTNVVGIIPGRGTAGPIGVVPLPGLQLDNYKVKKEFTRDSTDVSRHYFQRYLAHNIALDDLAILTVFKTSANEDSNFMNRFRQRIDALTLLDHPGIVAITRVDVTPANQPYVAYEYIPGESLEIKLVEWNKGQTPPSTIEALKLVRQLADAIAVAHAAGIIHNDLTPENIIIRADNTPVLVGFEFPIAPDSATTQETLRLLDYASPEQLEGKSLNERSNIYSLGIILYELFAGHHPKRYVSVWDIFDRTHSPKEMPLEEAKAGLAAETYQLVRNCLWQHESDRLATIAELIESLDKAIAAELASLKKAKRLLRWRQRLYVAAPIAFLAILFFAFVFFSRQALVPDNKKSRPLNTILEKSTVTLTRIPLIVSPTDEILPTPQTLEATIDLRGTALNSESTGTITLTLTPSPSSSATSTHSVTPVPTDTPTIAAETPTPECVKPTNWVSYPVKAGDSLFMLALRTGTTVAELKRVNCLSSNILSIGRILWLPSSPITATPSPTITPSPLPPTPTPTPTHTLTPRPTPTPPPLPTTNS